MKKKSTKFEFDSRACLTITDPQLAYDIFNVIYSSTTDRGKALEKSLKQMNRHRAMSMYIPLTIIDCPPPPLRTLKAPTKTLRQQR